MNNKANIPLIIAILIPIAMIIFIAASIYLPSLFIKPSTNFLYSTDGYSSSMRYELRNNKIEEISSPQPNYNYYSNSKPSLFIHDVKTNKSREVTYEEARTLTLNPANISKDGFELRSGYESSGMFPFGFRGSYGETYFLKKDTFSQKLNLNTSGNYYGFKFLGWIE